MQIRKGVNGLSNVEANTQTLYKYLDDNKQLTESYTKAVKRRSTSTASSKNSDELHLQERIQDLDKNIFTLSSQLKDKYELERITDYKLLLSHILAGEVSEAVSQMKQDELLVNQLNALNVNEEANKLYFSLFNEV